jgi:hypothetical protein
VQSKAGGKFHLKLNMGERPIANKYREGKMQRTLKRELKVLEIVKREAIRNSHCRAINQFGASVLPMPIGTLRTVSMVDAGPVGWWTERTRPGALDLSEGVLM